MNQSTFQPKIVGFLCNWCSYRAADLAGTARMAYPANVRILRVMCSGRVDPTFVMKAFSMGADAVILAGCHPGECHYLEQNYKTLRRFTLLRPTLSAMGIEEARIRLVWASAAEGQQLARTFAQIVDEVRALGPLRWRAGWPEDEERLAAIERLPQEHARSREVVR